MSKRRFEMVEGGASKFWEVEQRGDTLVLAWGKLGTAGQSQTKAFPSAEKALEAAAKLVKEKTGKGYAEVGAPIVASASVAQPAPATAPATAPQAAVPEPAITAPPAASPRAPAVSAPSTAAPVSTPSVERLRVLARTPHALLATDEILVATACVSGTGMSIVPQVRAARGLSTLDAVELLLAFYVRFDKRTPPKKPTMDSIERAGIRASLEQLRTELENAGTPRGRAQPRIEPVFVPAIDAALARAAASIGVDAGALGAIGDSISITGMGPYGYLQAVLDRGGAELLASIERGWLGAMIAQSRASKPKAPAYTGEARALVKSGAIMAVDRDRTLVAAKQTSGIAKVVVVHPSDPIEVLGEDVPNFLDREVAALRGEPIPPLGATGVKAVVSGWNRVALVRRDATPSPENVSRIGGRPIGVPESRWPRLDGVPMQHVLTIDMGAIAGWKPGALALFLSSARNHQAFDPGNRHSAVLLLSPDDLARGELELPSDVDPTTLLRAAILEADRAVPLDTPAQCRKQSFAGGIGPEWLQSPMEYPGTFALQIDGELVDVNLGDLGTMYVTTETAFVQSH